MSADLPPLGTRLFDLTNRQIAALPVGTTIGYHGHGLTFTRRADGGWVEPGRDPLYGTAVAYDRMILSYPEPTP